ncbi:hypothetical protein GCM10023231_19770 [Olivibacter ginsenosidimutans]|uniref:SGNH hydrolase-type esterase domain-containing protein n=1 Tax=Olivibacter ginsenosidimutans TaxID=1176537 RepID=A0ABP9B8P2_9SPHI
MKRTALIAALFFILSSFAPKETTWLALGDSITYLNDHLDETGHRVTKGYLTRVTEKFPQMHYINQGHNGWTAVRIAQEIENLHLIKADVYTVFLGTNDWWAGLPLGWIKDYQQNTGNGTVYGAFRTIINKIRNLNGTAKIILITPMQRADFVYINDAHNNAWGSYREKNGQSLAQFAEAVKTIGQLEQLEVIDLYHEERLALEKLIKYKRLKEPGTENYKNYTYPAYTTIPFHPDTDEYPYPKEAIALTYDGLHPSDKGNQVIASLLVKSLKNMHLRH